jgi:hypothetical protein
LCRKCAINVVPQAIARAVSVNNEEGDDELRMCLFFEDVQENYFSEVDRLAQQARAALTEPI